MATYYNENTIVWLNGAFVKATEAKMDFYSQSLHYGYSVFEGIRSYKTDNGETRIFKAIEHFDRLEQFSSGIEHALSSGPADELINATYETLKRNNLQDAYIRPVVYAPANMSFVKNTNRLSSLKCGKWQPFLGEKLLKVFTSSFATPKSERI